VLLPLDSSPRAASPYTAAHAHDAAPDDSLALMVPCASGGSGGGDSSTHATSAAATLRSLRRRTLSSTLVSHTTVLAAI
jgi:hypothetical protein